MWHAQGRPEPSAWGIVLADLVRHLSTAIRDEHVRPLCILKDVLILLLREVQLSACGYVGGAPDFAFNGRPVTRILSGERRWPGAG